MDASPVRIFQYFDGEKQNLIPLFQRAYRWTKKDWQNLWDDVLIQYDSDGETVHFMGAVVTLPVSTTPIGVNKHLVIDGQQRLTTLIILLCALRSAVDKKTSGRIEDCLINRHQDGTERYKLVPTQIDRDVFVKIVDKKELDSDGPLVEGLAFFEKKIKGKDLNGEDIDSARLFQVISSSLQVVMISLGKDDDPYLIFESLNHKGAPLTQADLVRNYLLMRFHHSIEENSQQETVYKEKWLPIERSLDNQLTNFLWHFAQMTGDNVKRSSIYGALKSRFSKLDSTQEVLSEMAILKRHAGHYKSFLTAQGPSTKVSTRLDHFITIDFSTCFPLLLRMFDSFNEGQISLVELEKCLELIESFHIRRAVCGVPTNAFNKLFRKWAGGFQSNEVVQWMISELKAGTGSSRWPDDIEFKKALVGQDQYQKRVTKHILETIELSFAHKEPVGLSTATIEHILPQTLTDYWTKALGPEAEKTHQELLHLIGNLTLSGYNSELSNHTFTKKTERLKKSHIEMNRWIAEQSEWTEKQIRERSNKLAETAILLWPRQ